MPFDNIGTFCRSKVRYWCQDNRKMKYYHIFVQTIDATIDWYTELIASRGKYSFSILLDHLGLSETFCIS